MEDKNKEKNNIGNKFNKKILWIILLVVVIIGVVLAVVLIKPKPTDNTNTPENFNKNTDNVLIDDKKVTEKVEYQRQETEEGILYSVDGKKVDADVVLTTNFFDTSVNDMYTNPQNYANKTIQIEGMYLENPPYTFVGRYSTSNVCQYCPAGYSYMEYELNGDIKEQLEDTKNWIRVTGTLAKGSDEASGFQEYYYLKVLNFEILNQRGEDTVVN